ncbi:uncharacterized protein LOC135207270 [Macrobrachium nipponense]|uniref:uncharacterized protein LOC135207270 n=1 Tax=Macrobrachium nipponense TaxID=159736 RepID=UPI0030C8BBFE
MPAFNAPKSLVDLSINGLCKSVFHILSQVLDLTEKTDAAVHSVENQLGEAFLKGKAFKSLGSARKKLELSNVRQMVKHCGDITVPFLEYIEDMPHEFSNIIFSKVLNELHFWIHGSDEDFEVEENEKDHDLKWNYLSRIRILFRVLVKCLFSHKTFVFNVNTFTEGYLKKLKNFVLIKEFYKRDDYMSQIEMNHKFFVSAFLAFKIEFSSLTSLSMRHLASGELLWNICCHCPNLWYLDLSGEMFDLQRYCYIEAAAGEFVNALTRKGKRLFKEADFIESLCGLYGNRGESHSKFEGTPVGCYYLRRLLLPDYYWDLSEEAIMVEEMIEILGHLAYLEEVSGICLYNVLCKLNESRPSKPLLLKLKKFDGTAGGHQLVAVDPKRLSRVKLPHVEEVIFIANVVMKPSALQELFPNLKHLTITPYDSRAYNFDSILPYLCNLVSLDVEFHESLSLGNMCELAKQCQSLKYLSITCPALIGKTFDASSVENIAVKNKKVSPFHLRVDKDKKREYEMNYCEGSKFIVYNYVDKLEATYKYIKYKAGAVIPEFSKLLKLQFFGLKYFDEETLYQIILGVPFLQAFTLVLSLGSSSMIQISDSYIGRLAPHLKRVKDVIIAAERPNEDYHLPLSGETIAHLIHFCQDIRSISRVGDWKMSQIEVEGLNYFMAHENFVLRIH